MKTEKIPKYRKRKRANPLGICNCLQCRYGRAGHKDSRIMKIKIKMRRWWSNKPQEKGAYTD
jgi:L,D-peptidoglycan transpeptidase YkuD (ErfK/YbiS/YcfS/YnhG family)